jgi:hypothetical protein
MGEKAKTPSAPEVPLDVPGRVELDDEAEAEADAEPAEEVEAADEAEVVILALLDEEAEEEEAAEEDSVSPLEVMLNWFDWARIWVVLELTKLIWNEFPVGQSPL